MKVCECVLSTVLHEGNFRLDIPHPQWRVNEWESIAHCHRHFSLDTRQVIKHKLYVINGGTGFIVLSGMQIYTFLSQRRRVLRYMISARLKRKFLGGTSLCLLSLALLYTRYTSALHIYFFNFMSMHIDGYFFSNIMYTQTNITLSYSNNGLNLAIATRVNG